MGTSSDGNGLGGGHANRSDLSAARGGGGPISGALRTPCPKGRVSGGCWGAEDELGAVLWFQGGSGGGGEGKSCFPKRLRGGFMEGGEFFVEVCCPEEKKPAGGDDGPAVIFRAGVLLAFRREFRV